MLRILVCSNTSKNIALFRTKLLQELIRQGNEVWVIAREDDYTDNLKAIGVKFSPLDIKPNGINPFTDLRILYSYYTAFKKINPNLIINYTIKPVIYGGIVNRLLNIPCISVITGLGSNFVNQTWLTKQIMWMYRYSQRKVNKVLFLNPNDAEFFAEHNLIERIKIDRLPGEGVDIQHFHAVPISNFVNIKFLFIGRIMSDKGIMEFVAAARKIKKLFSNVCFQILGPTDVDNRTAIRKEQLNSWIEEGVIEYLGQASDVRPFIEQAHCIVLPSYREGIPVSLLEASAMTRAIITTDAPGCKEVIEDGVNGFLCHAKNVDSLYDAIQKFLQLSPELMSEMGQKGRAKVTNEFEHSIVLKKYQQVLSEVLVPTKIATQS